MQKKNAIIWRESVYKKKRCPNCGKKLLSKSNQPINVESCSFFGIPVFTCGNCGIAVAKIMPYNGPGEPGEMRGKWDEKDE